MSTQDIVNFIKINERIATAGQPTKAQFEAARDEGYEAVINLAPGDAENHALPDEAGLLRSLGLEYHHIPVAWGNPRIEDFHRFSAEMENLQGRKVLIHCAANFRVTAFYSLHAMRAEGWTAEQADALIAKVWESRSDYRMDDRWKSFIAETRRSILAA